MSDGDDDFDDDGGGGYGYGHGGGHCLRRGNRGPAVQSLQSTLAELGFACRIDGIFGAETEDAVRRFQAQAGISVDGKAGQNTFNKLAEAQQRRAYVASSNRAGATAPSYTAPSSRASASPGAVASLLGFAVGAALIYWFVTVVLPVLLLIAAGLAVIAVMVAILRFSGRTFGWATTLKGLAGAILVSSLIGAYVANFTGDFEAKGSGSVGHMRPHSGAAPCGDAVSDGDNLWFADADRTTDTLEGRWARVKIHNTSCWVPFSRLRFQRGVFMSIVGKVGRLRSTTDEHRMAQLQALESLDRETASLYAT